MHELHCLPCTGRHKEGLQARGGIEERRVDGLTSGFPRSGGGNKNLPHLRVRRVAPAGPSTRERIGDDPTITFKFGRVVKRCNEGARPFMNFNACTARGVTKRACRLGAASKSGQRASPGVQTWRARGAKNPEERKTTRRRLRYP